MPRNQSHQALVVYSVQLWGSTELLYRLVYTNYSLWPSMHSTTNISIYDTGVIQILRSHKVSLKLCFCTSQIKSHMIFSFREEPFILNGLYQEEDSVWLPAHTRHVPALCQSLCTTCVLPASIQQHRGISGACGNCTHTHMRPGIVLHQEEPAAHCTRVWFDYRSEDFILDMICHSGQCIVGNDTEAKDTPLHTTTDPQLN